MSLSPAINSQFNGTFEILIKGSETSVVFTNSEEVKTHATNAIQIKVCNQYVNSFYFGPPGEQYILNYQNCTFPNASNFSSLSDFITLLQNRLQNHSGVYSSTITGAANTTTKINYYINGRFATLIIGAFVGTASSTATSLYITLPNWLIPTLSQYFTAIVESGSSYFSGQLNVYNSSLVTNNVVLELDLPGNAPFATTGNNGLPYPITITYIL